MMAGRLFTGTSGYSYKEWRGAFFPEDLAPDQFLSYYSRKLRSVEINNTFYRFPTETVLEHWRDETPESFVFAVKANQRITHKLRLKNVEQVTADFVERCAVVGERLGPLLFQLPPNFVRNDERLDAFLAALPAGGRYAIEFRHKTWFEDSVFERLAEAKVALVQSEDDKSAAPRIATTSFCYVRLRKVAYSDDDLDDWRAWIDQQLAEQRDVFVYLKHDEAGVSPGRVLGYLETGRPG